MKARKEGRTIREHEDGRYGNPTRREFERKLGLEDVGDLVSDLEQALATI